ncbi:MAG: ribonuclease HIII [Anaerorhabdus sp.]
MKTFTRILTDIQLDLLKKSLLKQEVKPSSPYIEYQWKTDGCTITAYNSKKVVFQGIDASFFAEQFPDETTSLIETHAGSDEVGTGDYFGPVCVCACFVDETSSSKLKALQVQDSKAMDDTTILKIGEQVMALCPHSLLILTNDKYNQIQPENNMNKIKAKLHNQAYLHLSKKIQLPDMVIIDQFTPEKNYYSYLAQEPQVIDHIHFETKAESKYLAVACASVIARYAFLKQWEIMEKQFDFSFPKGAGDIVDQKAAIFVKKYGKEALKKVAKIHFKNTKKLSQYL